MASWIWIRIRNSAVTDTDPCFFSKIQKNSRKKVQYFITFMVNTYRTTHLFQKGQKNVKIGYGTDPDPAGSVSKWPPRSGSVNQAYAPRIRKK